MISDEMNRYLLTHFECIDDIDLEMVWDVWDKDEWEGLLFCKFCEKSFNLSWGQAKKIQVVWLALNIVEWIEYHDYTAFKRTGLLA